MHREVFRFAAVAIMIVGIGTSVAAEVRRTAYPRVRVELTPD
jgi:hypothetical protein